MRRFYNKYLPFYGHMISPRRFAFYKRLLMTVSLHALPRKNGASFGGRPTPMTRILSHFRLALQVFAIPTLVIQVIEVNRKKRAIFAASRPYGQQCLFPYHRELSRDHEIPGSRTVCQSRNPRIGASKYRDFRD